MSRRPSDSRISRSDTARAPDTSLASKDSEEASTASLESLLASCGALQAALRKNDDSEVCSEEVTICEPGENAPGITDELPAEEQQSEMPFQEPELSASPGGTPSEPAGWIDSLRYEFRASIDELKVAQSEAAASQSAVLKTLTEIIFQSSTVRDSSNDGLDQKLAEFEDRILNRISQAGSLTVASEVRRAAHSPDHFSNHAEAVKKNSGRSWAEIRNDLVMESESEGSDLNHDPVETIDLESESTGEEAGTPECECILEVPQAVDPETLDEQELRVAFYEREEFIAKLISRLRHQYQKSNGHLPAEQLKHMAEHLPQELAAQVLQTLEQLNELARVGELELSLERARLARQINQLDHSRQLIKHNARQIGLTLEEDGTVSNPQKLTLRNSGSRRWLSKLGFGL